MTVKSIFAGTFVAAIIMFGLGGLWHMHLFNDVYAGSGYIGRAEPIMHLMILGEISRAAMMAFIYPYGYQGGTPLKEGARFGVLVNLFFGITATLWAFGLHPMENLGLLLAVEVAFMVVSGTLAGIAIAWLHNKLQ